MQSHQDNPVFGFVQTIYIRYQRNLLQKSVQRRFLRRAHIAGRLINQLFHVLQTCFSLDLAFRLQILLISRLFQNRLDKFRDRKGRKPRPEVFDLLRKLLDLIRRLADRRHAAHTQQRIIKAHAIGRRIDRHFSDRGRTDAALRHIDDTLNRQIIAPIRNRL